MRRRVTLSALLAVPFLSACALNSLPAVAERRMAELWVDPADIEQRDLLWGSGGRALAPDRQRDFALLEVDKTGFSAGYDVRDHRGQKWSVKLGPEAQTEVVVSRLLWAIGYHQPVLYYVPGWTLNDHGKSIKQPEARFRLESDGGKNVGDWSWRDNPFIGSRPFEGLFVFMVLVNNWDLKATNNVIYRVQQENDDPRFEYVVKDLGGSLGKTSWPFFGSTRNDVDGFVAERFIDRVVGNRVVFRYGGAWREPHVVASASPADVRWVCDLLARLSPQQWSDAFRAGGYSNAEAARFIQRLREKVAEGQHIG
jgi:hypothetical protein